MELKLLSVFNGAGEGGIVGVFQFGAEGKAAGEAGNLDAEAVDKLVEIHGGLLSLKVGVGGQNNLIYRAVLESVGKLPDSDVVGADPLGWGNSAVEHMIESLVDAGML